MLVGVDVAQGSGHDQGGTCWTDKTAVDMGEPLMAAAMDRRLACERVCTCSINASGLVSTTMLQS